MHCDTLTNPPGVETHSICYCRILPSSHAASAPPAVEAAHEHSWTLLYGFANIAVSIASTVNNYQIVALLPANRLAAKKRE